MLPRPMARRRCIGLSIGRTSPPSICLLKAGANAKAANGFGATPLSLAAENGNAAIAQRLLDAGADANERLLNNDTVLMMAARTGNVATMKVLLDRGADVNAKETARGTTALMWAAAQRHPAAVQLLVDRGADVSAASNPAWQDRPVRYAKAVGSETVEEAG